MNYKLITLLTLSCVVFSCTKKLDYKEQYKEDVINKSQVDTSSEYLYVPSMATASRTSKVARPFWMGQEKRVRLQFTDKSLQVLEIESDARFNSNTSNSKLVMEIPIAHLEYHCAKDKYGECRNEEEEDKDIPWSQKNQFKPDFNQVKFAETNILPIQMENLYGGSCYTEVGARPVGFEFTKDTVNFKIERTFNASLRCLDGSGLESLSDLTTTAVYHYSFAKISSLASTDYKTVAYPQTDQNTFGFFETRQKQLDIDNNTTVSSEKILMNRWNPHRKEIVYYLSDEFAKPENKAIRQSTYDVFNRMNRGLKEAGAQFQMVLKDNEGKEPGDIRNSMIVMVEDPVASSVIGYGPAVVNPTTGEILSARVVMYLGTINKYVKYSYDEVRQLHQDKKLQALKATSSPSITPSADIANKSIQNRKLLDLVGLRSVIPDSIKKSTHSKNNFLSAAKSSLINIKQEVTSYNKNVSLKQMSPDIFLAQHHACALSGEISPINTTVDKNLTQRFGNEMKPWEELDENEKQAAIQIITPEVWSVTLTHELGHNLGLRHNFAGSEDKDNYYTDAELSKMGINHKVRYSSVMDYGSSELNVLPVLGKYDIAALKFGYTGQVETKTGFVSIKTSIADLPEKADLKNYEYCTDEQISVNAKCKQFDEGSSMVEVAQSLINQYKNNYSRRNFRNQAYSFSLMGDRGYAARIDSTFMNLRLFLETYERVANMPGITEEIWKSEPSLKDLKDATILTAQFFMEVILTPDIQCAVAKTTSPQSIIGVQALSLFDKKALSCFDLKMNDGYVMAGQAGKSFLSKKSAGSANPYADQVDVRGIWIDKAIAIKYLFSRTLGDTEENENYTLNQNKMSYFDIAELQDPLMKMTSTVLLNSVTKDIDFETSQKEVFKLTIPYDLFDSQLIAKSIDPRAMKNLGLENRDQYLQEVILAAVNSPDFIDADIKDQNLAMKKIFGVFKTKQVFGFSTAPKDTNLVTVNGDLYAAVTVANPIASMTMQLLKISRILTSVDAKKFDEILKLQQTGGKLSDKATAAEKQVMALGKDILESASKGQVKGPLYYEKILSLLPVL